MLKLLIYKSFLRHVITQWRHLTAAEKTLNQRVYTSCYNITEYVNNIKTLQEQQLKYTYFLLHRKSPDQCQFTTNSTTKCHNQQLHAASCSIQCICIGRFLLELLEQQKSFSFNCVLSHHSNSVFYS